MTNRDDDNSNTLHGIFLGALAFSWWGCFPIYWNLIHNTTAFEILAHRVFWSLWFALVVLVIDSQLMRFFRTIRNRRIIVRGLLTSVMISVNWALFIWAVTNGYVLQSSLGYFINPLLNVLLGVMLLGERVSRLQKLAVTFAAFGCVSMVFYVGEFPWLGLGLASTFAIYALLRKTSTLDSLKGFALETLILSPLALFYLCWLHVHHELTFLHQDFTTDMLLVASGSVTAVPLILFTQAARQIPLTMVGMLQYISPSMQFFLALFYFHEKFTWGHFISFSLIWTGLGFFSVDLWQRGKAAKRARVPAIG